MGGAVTQKAITLNRYFPLTIPLHIKMNITWFIFWMHWTLLIKAGKNRG